MNQATGKQESITKNVTYAVGSANASIALDKMNVLYIGVDNPVTIAASGGGDEKLQVSINGGGGTITRVGTGKYIVRVTTQADNARIVVTSDGKVQGSADFRVRGIPDPVGTIGGKMSGDNMTPGELRAQVGVGAYIKDFPFELKYQVTSFTLTADNDEGTIDEAPCQGYTWSPKAQSLIRNISSGKTITIDDIHAIGPDGKTRKIPSLVYYIH